MTTAAILSARSVLAYIEEGHDPAALAEVVMDLAARSRALQLRRQALGAKKKVHER